MNPEIRLELAPGLSAKFHPRALSEVIQDERLLALEKLDWRNPAELLQSHPRKATLLAALQSSQVMESLSMHDPHLVGDFPLGIDVPASELEILVGATDLGVLAARIESVVGRYPQFKATQEKFRGQEQVRYRFEWQGAGFEIIGQAIESDQQSSYRRFRVQGLLLALAGQWAVHEVQKHKAHGLKTELAFAKVFALEGEPDQTLVDLHLARLDTLRSLATKARIQPLV